MGRQCLHCLYERNATDRHAAIIVFHTVSARTKFVLRLFQRANSELYSSLTIIKYYRLTIVLPIVRKYNVIDITISLSID